MRGARAGAAEMMEFCQMWLRGQQQGLDAQYGLSRCDWQLSQVDKTVTYRRHGTVVAVAPFTMIGSFCGHNGTWLWSWANPAIHRDVTMNQQQTLACVQQVGDDEFGATDVTSCRITRFVARPDPNHPLRAADVHCGRSLSKYGDL